LFGKAGGQMVIHIEFDIKITDSAGKVLHRFENRFDEDVSSDRKQKMDAVLKIDFSDFLAEYLSSSGFFLREKLMNGRYSKKSNLYKHDFVPDEDTDEEESILNRLKDSELEYKIHIGSNKVLIGKIPLKIETEADSEILEEKCTEDLLSSEEKTALEEVTVSNKQSLSKNTSCSKEPLSSEVKIHSKEQLYSQVKLHSNESSFSKDKPLYSKKPSTADKLTAPKQTSDMESEQNPAHVCGPKDTVDRSGDAVIDTILNYTMMKAIEKYEDNIYQVWYEAPDDVEQLNPTIF
jgi:hypothetical protein